MSSISKFLKQQKSQSSSLIRLSVMSSSVSGLLMILQAWSLANVINSVIFQGQALADVMHWMWLIISLLLVRSLLVYFSEQWSFAAASRIKQSMRQRLLSQLTQLGMSYMTKNRSGELATVITDGIEGLQDYYAKYLPAISLAAFIPLAILVFVFPLDWKSGLIMLITAPLIPFFMILIGKGAEKLNQEQWQNLQRMGGHFLDVIQGLTTLKLFNASRREARVIARISNDYRLATMKVLRVAFLSALALEFFATVSIALVAVTIGFRLLYGEMDFLMGFFILLLAPEFYLPLRSMGTQYHAKMSAMGAAEKMLDVLEVPVPDNQTGQSAIPDQPYEIRIDRLTYAWHEQHAVLQDISLTIQPGEHIALVGPTGAGKTTLSHLLLGLLQPTDGNILINQTSLSEIDIQQWHQQIAWVPQKPKVVYGTVAENIALGLENVDREAIVSAAEQANLSELINELPHGLDTLIGESARGLSGGEVQRLVLARAFLRNPRLVILDEATANLDQQTESLIEQAIARLSQDRTLFFIAHRLATVKKADRIVVLDQGRIVQQGSHEELSHTDGLYKQLIASEEIA